MDVGAQEQLLWLAQDFVDKVICQSMRLAKHARRPHVQVQDIAFILKKHWNLEIPSIFPVTTTSSFNSSAANRVLTSGARLQNPPEQNQPKKRSKPNST